MKKKRVYHVVVLTGKDRIVSKFNDYQAAKVFRQACEELLPVESHKGIHMVWAYCSKPRPDGIEVKKGELWCPYCRKVRRFRKVLDYRKCEVCYVSDAEYDVERYNPEIELERYISEQRRQARKAGVRKKGRIQFEPGRANRGRARTSDVDKREAKRERARKRKESKQK